MKYIDLWGDTIDLKFVKAKYYYGDVAIIAVDADTGEEWATVTVNLPYPLDDGCVFMDTNNHKAIVDAMVNEGYIELTGLEMPSGFCMYPEARLNEEWFAGLQSYEF